MQRVIGQAVQFSYALTHEELRRLAAVVLRGRSPKETSAEVPFCHAKEATQSVLEQSLALECDETGGRARS